LKGDYAMGSKEFMKRFYLILFGVGLLSLLFVQNVEFAVLIMLSACFQNTAYSMTSRAGNRNNAIYYAFAILFSDIAFYTTLHWLVSKDMTLFLWIPYTIATVAGSVSGTQISMKIEKLFNITTKNDKSAKISKTVKIVFSVILAGLIIFLILLSKSNPGPALVLTLLVALKNASFSAVRRSRNTNNGWYHSGVSVLDGVLWYLMWRELVMSNLSFTLLPYYMFGNIVGGMMGQNLSIRFEKLFGLSADSHINGNKEPSPFIPALAFAVVGVVGAFIFGDWKGILIMMGLAIGQNISFSLVSRARSRNNIPYHAIASIFSNGVWYLTFRHLKKANMPPSYVIPYVCGTIVGSLIGVGLSMKIEEKLNATSDDHVKSSN